MAERVLYDHLLDKEFQVSQLVDRLPWLPEVLAASEPSIPSASDPMTSNFRALLDTALVFGGARTAALHPVSCLKSAHDLVRRLNSILDTSKNNLRLEIVYRGPSQFFITRACSPRFDWSVRLTHTQVGRNLDYFAAGHMFRPPFPDRGALFFIETNTTTVISVEAVLLESLSGFEFYNQLASFSDRKEQLMNETMQELDLKYRFKWFLNTPEERQVVKTFMEASVLPPNDEWWEKYFYLLNWPTEPDARPHLFFCRHETHFRQHWPLLQFLYFFNSKYVRHEFFDINTHCDFDYWATIRTVFAEVEFTLTKESDLQESAKYCEEIKSRLQPLAAAADSFVSTRTGPVMFPQPPKMHWALKLRYGISQLFYHASMKVEELKIWLFQRWKHRKPRIHLRPALPAGAIGDSYWI
jgi:hypothetical protein